MRIERSAALPLKRKSMVSRFTAVLASVLLVTSLVPVGAIGSAYASPAYASSVAAAAAGESDSWASGIDKMLEGKNYVEGEAVVIIATGNAAGLASVDEAGDAAGVDVLGGCEELFATSADTVSTALGTDEANDAVLASAQATGNSEAAAADDSDVAIVFVQRDGMTTKELLEALASDPRVISAEPNYVGTILDDGTVSTDAVDAQAAEADVSATANAGANGNSPAAASDASAAANGNSAATSDAATAQQANGSSASDTNAAAASNATAFKPGDATQISADDTPDMTGYQWANEYDSSSTVLSTDELSPIDANVPYWNTDTENASGVIAVVDTGVDYTHPDLQDVMFDMSDYMDTVGGGKYGYNSATSAIQAGTPSTDPMDYFGHGTHCAGIIAAQCNGKGTTGAANGVKILACRAASNNGGLALTDIIRSYSYLSRAVDAGVDLRAINNSWGGTSSDPAFSVAVAELGKKGAISVIASGNSSSNNDELAATSTFAHTNPYAVVVDSSDMEGNPSPFSCYGQETTDLYSPGSTILSTIPQAGSKYLPSFVEKAQNSSNAAYDTFDGTGSIEMYVGYGEDAVKEENRVTASGGNYHYDESGSLCVTGKQLKATESTERSATSTLSHRYSVTFKIPVTKSKLDSVADFGVAFTSNSKAICRAMAAVEVQSYDGSIANFTDMTQAAGCGTTYGWNNLSVSLGTALSSAGQSMKYPSLVWHSDGTVNSDGEENGYIIVPMEIALATASKSEIADDDCFYFDCAGLGNATLPYQMMCGTSMATPLATGAAVICSAAVDQTQDASNRAKQTAELLKSCTTKFDQFTGLCTQNGTLDLSKLSNREAASPVVTDVAIVEGSAGSQNYIDITGTTFGGAGTVTIDEYTAEIVSWSNTSIRVKAPTGMLSGKHEVTVTTANGSSLKAATLRFASNAPEGDTPLYEETIAIDDSQFADNTRAVTLIGLNDYIYAFQDVTNPTDNATNTNTVKKLYRYNTNTSEWKYLGYLPSYDDPVTKTETYGFASVSVTLWEGKILMLGRGGSGQWYTQHLYEYDPDTNEWTQLSDLEKNIPMGAAIVNADGTLIALGGTAKQPNDETDLESTDTSNNIWKIDMETGERTLLGSLSYPRSNWTRMLSTQLQVCASGSTIYVTGGICAKDNDFTKNDQPAERLVKQADGTYKSEAIDSYLPKTEAKYDSTYGLAAGSDGAVFCGLKVTEGNEDTYRIGNDGTTVSAFGKKLSDVPVAAISALAYHGKLYAIGKDEFNGGSLVMRATAFDTPEHPAGENADPEPETPKFVDVDYDNPDCKWYVDGVNFCASKGLIMGYANLDDSTKFFGVGNTLTRAELATILWRHFEPEAAAAYDEAATAAAKGVTSAGGVAVEGIADGTWYTAAANWAVENGVINGFLNADGSRDFAPDAAVSFEQLIAIIGNASGADVDGASASVLDAFSDCSSVSDWARQSMAWGVTSELVHGYGDGTLAPGENVKRERVAAVLMNAFEEGVLK